MNLPDEDDGLTTRAYNVLRFANLLDDEKATRQTAERLSKFTVNHLHNTPNCGKKTITELTAWLQKHGLSWCDSREDAPKSFGLW